MQIYEDKKKEKRHFIDASSPAKSNWLRYINCARNMWEENVYSFVCDNLVFYMTTKEVEPNTELLTWYGRNDGLMLGITKLHPGRKCFHKYKLAQLLVVIEYFTVSRILNFVANDLINTILFEL